MCKARVGKKHLQIVLYSHSGASIEDTTFLAVPYSVSWGAPKRNGNARRESSAFVKRPRTRTIRQASSSDRPRSRSVHSSLTTSKTWTRSRSKSETKTWPSPAATPDSWQNGKLLPACSKPKI